MRLHLPSSLRGRLIAIATLLVAAATLAACLVMSYALHRFVVGQIDDRLDAQAFAIASALTRGPHGRLTTAAALDAPPFDREGFGWFWQVEGLGGEMIASRSLDPGQRLRAAAVQPPRPQRQRPGPVGIEVEGPGGRLLHGRLFVAPFQKDGVTIIVTAPPQAIDGPLREALLPVVATMLVLAAALIAAVYAQVALGLRPLRVLRDDLAAVRAGKAQRVSDRQPSEIAPLAAELNSLIAENADGLERARRHVANLAHGLKTPLADLALTLQEPGRDPAGDAAALVEHMDRRVRHHLARARAAALGGAARASTPLRQHVDDLVLVLGRIYAPRELVFSIDVDTETTVACEPQDLDEMLGNLLDNACKWATGDIRVSGRQDGASICLAIEDDGNGLPEDAVPEALSPGQRLDEMSPGHGFGLSIALELAELYGGAIAIRRSPLGGLLVELRLPASRT